VHIEQAVSDAVAKHLETELGERGLLLTADRLAEADADAAQRGARLLTSVIDRCYAIRRQGGLALALEFKSEREAARLQAALAFGAATADLLAPVKRDVDQVSGSVELLCAMFNLGVGLVDSLCDEDAETGCALLELVEEQDLGKGAEEPRGRGWLRGTLPLALAQDHAVAFTADIIEAFFETLHAAYPGDGWVQHRLGVGKQLVAALVAERQSVGWSVGRNDRQQLIEFSRLTSVMPFQIIETLARGDHPNAQRTAGTLLGEAMWRIDDLVDLCQDVRCGALNGILLAAMQEPGPSGGERDRVAALESLLTSTDIASAATYAAENLLAGLHLAGGRHTTAQNFLPTVSFLHFVQRYTGIVRHHTS
jgi:hypothetical protein